MANANNSRGNGNNGFGQDSARDRLRRDKSGRLIQTVDDLYRRLREAKDHWRDFSRLPSPKKPGTETE